MQPVLGCWGRAPKFTPHGFARWAPSAWMGACDDMTHVSKLVTKNPNPYHV